jgi:hypothetical protein
MSVLLPIMDSMQRGTCQWEGTDYCIHSSSLQRWLGSESFSASGGQR